MFAKKDQDHIPFVLVECLLEDGNNDEPVSVVPDRTTAIKASEYNPFKFTVFLMRFDRSQFPAMIVQNIKLDVEW